MMVRNEVDWAEQIQKTERGRSLCQPAGSRISQRSPKNRDVHEKETEGSHAAHIIGLAIDLVRICRPQQRSKTNAAKK